MACGVFSVGSTDSYWGSTDVKFRNHCTKQIITLRLKCSYQAIYHISLTTVQLLTHWMDSATEMRVDCTEDSSTMRSSNITRCRRVIMFFGLRHCNRVWKGAVLIKQIIIKLVCNSGKDNKLTSKASAY